MICGWTLSWSRSDGSAREWSFCGTPSVAAPNGIMASKINRRIFSVEDFFTSPGQERWLEPFQRLSFQKEQGNVHAPRDRRCDDPHMDYSCHGAGGSESRRSRAEAGGQGVH